MSPFAHLLHDLRVRHGVRQVELAKRIGFEQSYISALESGTKGPPTQEFADRLIAVLALSEDEADDVRSAVDESQRKLVIEPTTRADIYRVLKKLRHTLETLSPGDVEYLSNTLSLLSRAEPAEDLPHQRLRRQSSQEARM